MTVNSRLTGALPGGGPKRQVRGNDIVNRLGTNTYGFSSEFADSSKLDPMKDWRVRISLPPGSKFAYRMPNEGEEFGGIIPSIQYPLVSATGAKPGLDGVVFPHTPQLTVAHNARYQEQALTHSNYKAYFYEGSDVAPITITGLFTCQNSAEALYLQAALQFLRSCTKMFFGKATGQVSMPSGTPPTLVRLSGYGDFYLPSISCVVTSVSHAMPDDCDYVKYMYGNSSGWMPTVSTLTVTVQPVVSRKRQSESMTLDDFAAGQLINTENSTSGGLL